MGENLFNLIIKYNEMIYMKQMNTMIIRLYNEYLWN